MRRLAVWIATLGPLGRWPLGPGTLASVLVAGAWAWLAPAATTTLAVAGVLLGIGILVAGVAERQLGTDDGRIVVDEAAGMALALTGVPAGAAGAAIACLLFRVFDIAKPPPVSWSERVGGGVGVMLDDAVAGALAAAIGAGLFRVVPALAGGS